MCSVCIVIIIAIFSSVFDHTSSYARRLRKKHRFLQWKAVRTLWSRSGRGPSSIEPVAGAQFYFSAGVDKSFSRGFCVRPYLFPYVRLVIFYFCVFFYLARSTAPKPKQQKTTAAYREHAYLQLTKTLPPTSSSRQHHAHLAGPRYAMPSCLYRMQPSLTRASHLVNLSTAAAFCT